MTFTYVMKIFSNFDFFITYLTIYKPYLKFTGSIIYY